MTLLHEITTSLPTWLLAILATGLVVILATGIVGFFAILAFRIKRIRAGWISFVFEQPVAQPHEDR